MKTCCIEGCEISSKKDITLFEFPTSRLLRKRWLHAISAAGKLAPDALVCSRHFAAEDYEDVRGKVRLKSKVVPTLFGDEAHTPKPLKDPLGLADSEESQESTYKEGPITNIDNHNGNVDKDNENVDKYNENIHNDKHGDKSKDTSPNKDTTENGHSAKSDNENVDIGNTKADTDNEKVANGNVANHNVDVDSGKVDEKIETDNEKVANDNRNVASYNVDVDSGNVDEKIETNNEKVADDNRNVASHNVNVDSGNVDEKVSKRVKKKWVPMRKLVAKRNGRIDMSEDSSSQDSVNSDLPPPPVLEDLEEHLPNYQIANLKTERQVAAMLDTVEPLETPMEQDIEEIAMEPHVPVFIELSVGQDSGMPDSEQPNDCLMVLESVQCDIDPTLMLEARAEEDDCCEQIDLDDDDDDDDVIQTDVTTPDMAPKKSKSPVDPISLLTSSDEDDVILQEPHIDTLSVSDETDEDDLPLHKLIKKEKKLAKIKKKKPESIKSILVGVTDYFCMHCNHTSTCRSVHERHVRSHLKSKEPPNPTATHVYQICKECGFTTSSKSQLHRHQKKHLNDKKFKCPVCSYRSKYNMSLMYHLKTHDFDPKMYNCGACGLELDGKKDLLTHQKVCAEMGEKYLCGVCGFVAKTKRNIKIHRNTVHKHKT